MMRRLIPICFLACVLLNLPGCRKPENAAQKSFLAMGTIGTLLVTPEQAGNIEAMTALTTNRIRELEQIFSIFNPHSELSRLNAQAGSEFAPLTPELRGLLEKACAYGADSAGAFDVTIAPLMELWGFRSKTTPVAEPTPEALQNCLNQTGYQHILFTENGVLIEHTGLKIDLGGLAKGYAVDECYEKLQATGLKHALINLGGNMRALGAGPGGRSWQVAVRHPFQRNRVLGVLTLAPGRALATSGNYERFINLNGKHYAHILDPRTGRPVQGMAAVTVAAPNAMEADALSTTLFVLGCEAGAAFLRQKPDCAALFVPDRQPLEIMITPTLAKIWTPTPEQKQRITILE